MVQQQRYDFTYFSIHEDQSKKLQIADDVVESGARLHHFPSMWNLGSHQTQNFVGEF